MTVKPKPAASSNTSQLYAEAQRKLEQEDKAIKELEKQEKADEVKQKQEQMRAAFDKL